MTGQLPLLKLFSCTVYFFFFLCNALTSLFVFIIAVLLAQQMSNQGVRSGFEPGTSLWQAGAPVNYATPLDKRRHTTKLVNPYEKG